MSEPIKFYTDKHVNSRIAKQLGLRGVDIIRCEDVGMGDASDEDHLKYATTEGRIVLTCDKDFLRLNYEWSLAEQPHAGIAFAAGDICNNISLIIRVLLSWHEFIEGEAATVAKDFYNQIKYISEWG